ncbi:hypothetical protein [Marimonas arenosa]|uniref:Gamma-glutamyl kinase n=1 Tax=Marimonas arenosa TaxID=1795305 RepID=A0AAE3WB58_9RHOB|nr:hypothetical protein [Marimonas arenosa]MDQ2089472.1 hypothetical protein [Marimonas arenosa]
MLVFFRENLALLAVPKTGTTAYEMALKRRADIIFAGRRKHANASFFHRKLGPFLKSAYGLTPERMAVIRQPIDHMRSWYRYRARDEIRGKPASTAAMTFDDFIEAALLKEPPECAKVGSQEGFLIMRRGQVPVHHLFAYDAQPLIRGFLEERFKRKLELKQYNVSPNIEAPLDPEVEARFRAAREKEFALYDRVKAAGGHLRQLLED